MWWVRPAGSWIRSRWRWGRPGPCCRFCADRPRWRIRSRCRRVSRSWAGRREPPTMSVALPYGRARAAAFMGKRMVEDAAGRDVALGQRAASAPPSTELPERLEGRTFLERWGATGDDVTAVRPDETYPVRAATLFGVEEHGRAVAALAALRDGEPERLGPLMEASQDGYDAMGLGHPAATAIVKEALARPGVLRRTLERGRVWRHRRRRVRARCTGRRGRPDPLNGDDAVSDAIDSVGALAWDETAPVRPLTADRPVGRFSGRRCCPDDEVAGTTTCAPPVPHRRARAGAGRCAARPRRSPGGWS